MLLKYIGKLIAVLLLTAAIGILPCNGAAAAAEDVQYIRVGLLQNKQQVNISADDDFVIKDLTQSKNYKFSKGKTVQISQKNGRIYVGGKAVQAQSVIAAVKNNAPVSVNGKKYRGALQILRRGNGLTVVNRLQLDEYLYGVIPNEMPTDWNGEALKAQAIAARSYALYDKNDGKHAADGFDVCTTTDCQVYGGIASENAAANRAVDATRGMVLTYQHAPICAVFHTASGGSTENSRDVWGADVPYLKAVNDGAERSPYMNWSVRLSAAQLAQKISAQQGNIGTLKAIDTSHFKQKADAEAKYIRFIGSKKSVNMTGAQLRSLLNLKSSNVVLSAAEKGKTKSGSYIKLSQSADIIIDGKGFGHRLGMSQWGAKSLADKGDNYRQILLHYYTDVQLESLY